MNLASKHCEPCEGGVAPFDQKNSRAYLKNIQGWSLSDSGKQIQKEYEFENFTEVVTFVNSIAELAESEGHHPDLFIHDYKKLRISLSTHAIGGLSENDFILAAKIDEIERY